jgi:hypothetical protein
MNARTLAIQAALAGILSGSAIANASASELDDSRRAEPTGEKNGCNGPNGCGSKKGDKEPNGCSGPNGCGSKK